MLIARKKRGKWQAAKSISIRIQLAPHTKKPGKKATDEDWEIYEKSKKENNLTQYAMQLIKELRRQCDNFGYENKELVIVADGSYCNKGIFSCPLDRVQLILRCRKDARLCEKSKEKKRFYDKKTFTPHDIYKDEKIEVQKGLFFYGRKNVLGKFKEKIEVYWQRGAKKRPLKCVVVFGIRYRRNKNGYTNYREPMYLLTTAIQLNTKEVIQWYFYRWEIEVTHRELKNDKYSRRGRSKPVKADWLLLVVSYIGSRTNKYTPHLHQITHLRLSKYLVFFLLKWSGIIK